ncbi:unnamed protein product [Adineta steineri]|uniref:Uncharacterized protein n=1 Tax=Adineta steineri TaxID=433720 RepID=A0A820K313_9BILA|nr:unnamed protein product [Adineta steineri]
MSVEKNRCGIDSSRCIDWTKIRRAGYKPETNESIELPYTATRSINSKEKSSKKTDKINQSKTKKQSAVKKNKHDVSSTRNNATNKSKSIKRNLNSDTTMMM